MSRQILKEYARYPHCYVMGRDVGILQWSVFILNVHGIQGIFWKCNSSRNKLALLLWSMESFNNDIHLYIISVAFLYYNLYHDGSIVYHLLGVNLSCTQSDWPNADHKQKYNINYVCLCMFYTLISLIEINSHPLTHFFHPQQNNQNIFCNVIRETTHRHYW